MLIVFNETLSYETHFKDYEAGVYVIIIIIFYCIGGAFLICTGMKKKHKHQFKEEDQVEMYFRQRRLIEKQARVDQIWHTDRYLRRIFSENENSVMENGKENENNDDMLKSIKDLISKSPKNVFSIPMKVDDPPKN